MARLNRRCALVVLLALFVACGGSESIETKVEASDSTAVELANVDAEAKADLAGAPLSGALNGIEVSGFKAFLDNKVFLKLYTGEDPDFEYGTRLLLFTNLENPANQDVRFKPESGFETWQIHVDSKQHENLQKVLMGNIVLEFQSGEEKDYRVPARIRIVATGEYPVNLEGTVLVATSGLVSKDGVVDRSHDHVDTIAYVAEQHVSSQHPDAEVEFGKPQGYMMQHGLSDSNREKGFLQAAYYSALYRVNGGSTQISKMQIGKKDGEWRVLSELQEGQVSAAHPINPPQVDRPPHIYKQLAAREFEKSIYASRGGWRKIKEPLSLNCGGGQREASRGFCRVAYGIYTDESIDALKCSAVTYLFDRVDGEWKLTETLPAGKKFNHRTDTVEERDGEIWGC